MFSRFKVEPENTEVEPYECPDSSRLALRLAGALIRLLRWH